MNKLALIAVVLIAACGGKKEDKGPTVTNASGSAPAGSAAPAGSGSAPAGSGSAAAGSGSDTGSGSSMAAGSGAGSGSAIVDDGIKFDKIPDGWEFGAGKLDTFEAVNDSKYPADNAPFVFEYGPEAKDMPTDPKEYAAVLEKGGMTVTKNEKTPTGHYFESADAFRYTVGTGDKRIHCGGSLYKGGDYDLIPKVRDEVVANAKKICQTAKL